MSVSGWPQAKQGKGNDKLRHNTMCCSWGIKANLNPCYMERLQYTVWGLQTNDKRGDKIRRGNKAQIEKNSKRQNHINHRL